MIIEAAILQDPKLDAVALLPDRRGQTQEVE